MSALLANCSFATASISHLCVGFGSSSLPTPCWWRRDEMTSGFFDFVAVFLLLRRNCAISFFIWLGEVSAH